MAAFEAWLVFLILVVNVVGELQRKRTLAASRGFLRSFMFDRIQKIVGSRDLGHANFQENYLCAR